MIRKSVALVLPVPWLLIPLVIGGFLASGCGDPPDAPIAPSSGSQVTFGLSLRFRASGACSAAVLRNGKQTREFKSDGAIGLQEALGFHYQSGGEDGDEEGRDSIAALDIRASAACEWDTVQSVLVRIAPFVLTNSVVKLAVETESQSGSNPGIQWRHPSADVIDVSLNVFQSTTRGGTGYTARVMVGDDHVDVPRDLLAPNRKKELEGRLRALFNSTPSRSALCFRVYDATPEPLAVGEVFPFLSALDGLGVLNEFTMACEGNRFGEQMIIGEMEVERAGEK